MNEKQAEDIYWVLTDKNKFTTSFPDENNYDRIKRERVKIANRYMELKSEHSFLDAERMAIVEWLEAL